MDASVWRFAADQVSSRCRQAVPTDEVFGIFATAPVIDTDELRADSDRDIDQDLRDPLEETGL